MVICRRVSLGKATSIVTLLGACSSSAQHEPTLFEDPERGRVIADFTPQFPDTGLVDWISYSDGVAAVTVVSEHRNDIPMDVIERSEGYVARTITVNVDEVLWKAEHSRAPIDDGDALEMLVLGWQLKGDRLLAMGGRFSPRLEVEGQYVMPLVRFERGWAPMTAASPVPMASSMIALADANAWNAESPARDELFGLSFAEMAIILANVAPDPVAARYFDLPPEERIQVVSREQP